MAIFVLLHTVACLSMTSSASPYSGKSVLLLRLVYRGWQFNTRMELSGVSTR